MARERGLDFNPYFAKQCVAAVLGLVAMLVTMHLDYRLLRKPFVVYGMVGGVMVLLVAVLFMPALNNSHRWFFIGGLSIQPSEIAKLVLIPFVAYQIDRKADRINSLSLLIPVAFLTATMAALIFLGRDLGTTVLLAIPPLVMVFLAGISARLLLMGGAMLLPMVAMAVALEPYRFRRFLAFMHPEQDPLGSTASSPCSPLSPWGRGAFSVWGRATACRSSTFCLPPMPTSSIPSWPKSWDSSGPSSCSACSACCCGAASSPGSRRRTPSGVTWLGALPA